MGDDGFTPGDLTEEDWLAFLDEVEGFEPVTEGELVAGSPLVFFGIPYPGV